MVCVCGSQRRPIGFTGRAATALHCWAISKTEKKETSKAECEERDYIRKTMRQGS